MLLGLQALEMQGKHSEAAVELSKICLIHRIFPPEECSVCAVYFVFILFSFEYFYRKCSLFLLNIQSLFSYFLAFTMQKQMHGLPNEYAPATSAPPFPFDDVTHV